MTREQLQAAIDAYDRVNLTHDEAIPPDERRLRAMQAAVDAAAQTWTPTHRHVKSGGIYRVVGNAGVQTAAGLHDMDIVVLYQSKGGSYWVRRVDEFDNRFEEIGGDGG